MNVRSILGVVVGSITDIVATNVLVLPVGIAAMIAGNVMQLPKARQSGEMIAAMHSHPILYGTSLILGAAASVLGGFVAASIARRSEVLIGALSSFLCVGSGIYGIVSGTTSEPMWLALLMMPASPALGALGGHLQLQRRSRRMKTALS